MEGSRFAIGVDKGVHVNLRFPARVLSHCDLVIDPISLQMANTWLLPYRRDSDTNSSASRTMTTTREQDISALTSLTTWRDTL
jgi:hypothetical protein